MVEERLENGMGIVLGTSVSDHTVSLSPGTVADSSSDF